MAVSSPKSTKPRAAILAIVVFVILLAVPASAMKYYGVAAASAQSAAYEKEATLTSLVAQAINVKVTNLVNIAQSMASSSDIVSAAAAGNWDAVANDARDMQNEVGYYDTFIDRISIYDTNGIQQAAYPALVGGLGSSAASSSWYKQLAAGAPYVVGNVTLRLSVPQIQVIGIQVPVKTSAGKTVGYLSMQIPTSNFLAFGENASLGMYGFTYIVDSQGNLIADPHYSSDNGTVINIASEPVVKAVMSGQGGNETVKTNGLESIITYEPVPVYGWGVVSEDLYTDIIGGTSGMLTALEVIAIASLLIDFLIAYILFRLLDSDSYRETKKKRS